ncbi:MAG: hypothetical protein Q4A66_13655 [Eubacteriales bacterium]|nr:hypothetical protein [Eubacteriales bacterium]
MAAVTLRTMAREAMLAGGGRGFMRFAPPGDALLVTDALRRCKSEADRARVTAALEQAGFFCREAEGLLYLTPQDALLCGALAPSDAAIDWESGSFAEAAFAARLMRCPAQPMTPAGRRLAMDALRLTGMPGREIRIDALRAQAAVMLRSGDRSGMHEAGAALMDALKRRTAYEA